MRLIGLANRHEKGEIPQPWCLPCKLSCNRGVPVHLRGKIKRATDRVVGDCSKHELSSNRCRVLLDPGSLCRASGSGMRRLLSEGRNPSGRGPGAARLLRQLYPFARSISGSRKGGPKEWHSSVCISGRSLRASHGRDSPYRLSSKRSFPPEPAVRSTDLSGTSASLILPSIA